MNTNEKTDAMLTEAMTGLNQAVAMCDIYKMILDNIPKNEWFRCKDVNCNRSCQQVAALMKRLKDAGFAERRVVDDGLKTFTVRQRVIIDNNNEPDTIDAYDCDGKFIDRIANPRYYRNERYEDVQQTVKASHAEYRLIVPLD